MTDQAVTSSLSPGEMHNLPGQLTGRGKAPKRPGFNHKNCPTVRRQGSWRRRIRELPRCSGLKSSKSSKKGL